MGRATGPVWAGLFLLYAAFSHGADSVVRAFDTGILRSQTNCVRIVLQAQGNENALG